MYTELQTAQQHPIKQQFLTWPLMRNLGLPSFILFFQYASPLQGAQARRPQTNVFTVKGHRRWKG